MSGDQISESWEKFSSVSETTDARNTPTESTVSYAPSQTYESRPSMSSAPELYYDAVPWPGKKFLIKHEETNQIVSVVDGNVQLGSIEDCHRGGHWLCVERDGWLGFRNTVSGTYLGHNNHSGIRAEAKQHERWEFFCVRQRPDKGYSLLCTWNWKMLSLQLKDKTGQEARHQYRGRHSWDTCLTLGDGEGPVWTFLTADV